MVYLQVEKLSKAFNEKILFENISFGIHKGQKTALIAKNGAGKSTLLKIIAGLENYDNGSVVIRNDLNIAYLDQNPTFDESLNVIDGVFTSDKTLPQVIKEYRLSLTAGDKERLSAATDMMDRLEAWNYEERIRQILSKLNITDFEQKISTLSGGQKKRLALASALISQPELLILDEPTNHLDLGMIGWLENFLKQSHGTLLMVTHDRYFLDRVCNDILEIDDGLLFRYKGNYSYFLEKRSQRIENENIVAHKAKKLMQKELEWMRRSPMARTGKSKSRISAFDDIKEKASQKRDDKPVRLDMKANRLGNKIMEINYISKAYDGATLIKDFTYVFKKNEKIGVVGPNGCGKTTLLNILAGLIRPDKGAIDVGATVNLSYFKQSGMAFAESQRVIDVAKSIAEVVKMSDGSKISASEFLNQFLFTPEIQYNPVSKLSGGEKRRLYLMTVLMQSPNFLILDEPTNDLDILTLNVLEAYLKNFNGCVLFVSHDRFFMDKIVEHLFVFEENGVVNDFPGNYSQYLEHKNNLASEHKKKTAASAKVNKQKPVKAKPEKLTYKEERELETLELDLEALEDEKNKIEHDLYESQSTHDEVLQKTERLGELLRLIETKTDRWLELSTKYE